jgi:hypothetical protein
MLSLSSQKGLKLLRAALYPAGFGVITHGLLPSYPVWLTTLAFNCEAAKLNLDHLMMAGAFVCSNGVLARRELNWTISTSVFEI